MQKDTPDNIKYHELMVREYLNRINVPLYNYLESKKVSIEEFNNDVWSKLTISKLAWSKESEKDIYNMQRVFCKLSNISCETTASPIKVTVPSIIHYINKLATESQTRIIDMTPVTHKSTLIQLEETYVNRPTYIERKQCKLDISSNIDIDGITYYVVNTKDIDNCGLFFCVGTIVTCDGSNVNRSDISEDFDTGKLVDSITFTANSINEVEFNLRTNFTEYSYWRFKFEVFHNKKLMLVEDFSNCDIEVALGAFLHIQSCVTQLLDHET